MEIYKFINKSVVDNGMEKKGQVTIFVIIAIVIVGAAILFFTLTDVGRDIIEPIIPSGASGSFDIESEFSNCVLEVDKNRDDVPDVDSEIDRILSQGGMKEPDFFYLHGGVPYSYLCHTSLYYEACINNRPLLLQSIEKEIDTALSPLVAECFNDLENELRDRGFNSRAGDFDVVVDIIDGEIDINMDVTLNVKKGETTQTIDKFEIRKKSEAYQLISVGSSIVEFEAVYGVSDPVAYMSVYPQTRVEQLKQSDGTTLYKISDRNTLEEFNFATRSYARPPGYGL